METNEFPLVLLVDDEPANLRVLSDALAGQGFNIAVAMNGERALAQVKAFPPDLILLDALMPGMDGFEVCRRLKAEPATEAIPVVFMTSLSESAQRVRGLSLGAADYLAKPFDRDELLVRVKMQLSLRKASKLLSEKNAELEKAQAALEEALATLKAEKKDLEMSTPIVPITDQILVMPLVGRMDVERAGRVLQAALEAAARTQAEVLILDITGIPAADRHVAATIVDTARALKLLGVFTVLTGIRPDMASSLVELSVDLRDMETKSTLQSGIAHAMRRTRRAPAASAPRMLSAR